MQATKFSGPVLRFDCFDILKGILKMEKLDNLDMLAQQQQSKHTEERVGRGYK